jgi:hypothetical protein
MTSTKMFAQIAIPATLLMAGMMISPSNSYAGGTSTLRPTVEGIFDRGGRGGHDDPNECTFDDRCARDHAVKFEVAGRGGHDDPNECTIDDRCVTDAPRTFDRG